MNGPEFEETQLKANLNSSDPYAVLGVSRQATAAEIKRAYFSLVRQHSPEEEPENFKKLRAAYEKLRSTEVKQETDLFLPQPPVSWGGRKRQRKFKTSFSRYHVEELLLEGTDFKRTNFESDWRPVKL
jgi:curved DNA-binding protein CbpA